MPKVQTITINLPLKGCTGAGGVTSGISTGKSVTTGKVDCVSFLLNPKNTTITTLIKWTPVSKGTSTYTAVSKSVAGAKVLTATLSGPITKGAFKGHKVATTVQVSFTGVCTKTTAINAINIKGIKPFTIT